jgi:hypothetical protein
MRTLARLQSLTVTCVFADADFPDLLTIPVLARYDHREQHDECALADKRVKRPRGCAGLLLAWLAACALAALASLIPAHGAVPSSRGKRVRVLWRSSGGVARTT